MNTDGFILLNAFISFLVFLIVHLCVFRFLRDGEVLKWLVYCVMMGVVVNVAWGFGYTVFLTDAVSRWGFLSLLIVLALSLAVYILVAFLYTLCIFGLHESSIRMRLLRELFLVYPEGLTTEQILARYNSRIILKRRLERLTTSGELTQDGDVYRINKPQNFFLLKHYIGQLIEKVTAHQKG